MHVSIITSFNKRLSEDSLALTYVSVNTHYPEVPFYVYHENSFDKSQGNGIIDFKPIPNCHIYDIFDENTWLESFLKTSKFSTCHTLGVFGTFDPPYYWQRNAIYWFRKVVALHSALEYCTTDYMMWLDCDVFFPPEKCIKFDDTVFDWCEQHDVVSIKRNDRLTETGFIVFNMKRGGRELITNMLEWYRSHKVFEFDRWDDCQCMDYVTSQMPHIKFGGATPQFGAPFSIYDYLQHNKKGHIVRDNGQRGI
jgi:hypothetical protein